MSKREAKKQAETPSDKFTPFPVQTVETLEDVENVALALLHFYRPVLELQQEARRVLDACAESPETSAGRELKTQLILDAWERVSRAGWALNGAERIPLADVESFLRQAEKGLHKNLNRTNINLIRAARRLLPDVWERLEILPVGPPAQDLDAAERDWKRLVKAAGAERARRERDEKTGAGKGEAEDLQPTSCLTSLQVIGSGQVHDGWEALRAILASASKRVDIEDAHINADVVALLRNAPEGVAVRVLTRKLYEDADPAFRRLAKQKSGTLEVRTTADLHPRRVYVDDRAYILDDSIKDLASKTASCIVPVDKPTETRRLMEDFERRWATAGVRIRPKA